MEEKIMKKTLSLILAAACLGMALTGCTSKEDAKKLAEYKNEMETFFTTVEDVDSKIKDIDPNSADAMDQLYEQFDVLEAEFSKMAALEVPTEGVPETFAYIEALADDASNYMVQANEYLKQSFDESSYNENTLNGSLECFNRANKRVGYIVDLLHGNLPQDENISYSSN